jgi:hypothetical protein
LPAVDVESAQVSGLSIARAICAEAKRGCDVIVLRIGRGAGHRRPVVEQVVSEAPCHVAVMKAPVPGWSTAYPVPVDGSVASRLAVEWRSATRRGPARSWRWRAHRAAAAGGGVRRHERNARPRRGPRHQREESCSGYRSPSAVRRETQHLHLAFDRSSAISQEVERGHHDLVVLGAENRAIQHRCFRLRELRLIRGPASVIVVVPNLSGSVERPA